MVFRSKSGKIELKITKQKLLVQEFLKVLSVAHDCMVDQTHSDKIVYQG
jgi:phospholipid-transporting ATPase